MSCVHAGFFFSPCRILADFTVPEERRKKVGPAGEVPIRKAINRRKLSLFLACLLARGVVLFFSRAESHAANGRATTGSRIWDLSATLLLGDPVQ